MHSDSHKLKSVLPPISTEAHRGRRRREKTKRGVHNTYGRKGTLRCYECQRRNSKVEELNITRTNIGTVRLLLSLASVRILCIPGKVVAMRQAPGAKGYRGFD